MRIVVQYAGRFQPPHKAHVVIYNKLAKKYGYKNVYVCMSGIVEKSRSPLTFEWRKKLWQELSDIDGSHIKKTRRPYSAQAMAEALNLKLGEFIFVTVVGRKDAARLSKYFKPLPKNIADLENATNDYGYVDILPNVRDDDKILNASSIRKLLGKTEVFPEDVAQIQKITGYSKATIQQLRSLFREHRETRKKMIVEGGAAGHMLHPFEDLDMTFSDIDSLTESLLSGNIDKSVVVNEKVDGWNLFFTVINGRPRFARNKTHLINNGELSLTIRDMASRWSGNKETRDTFIKSARAITMIVNSFKSSDILELFGNGKNWINMEIVNRATPNVFNYGNDFIVFHNILSASTSGTFKVNTKLRSKFLAFTKKVEGNIFSGHVAKPPIDLALSKSSDFSNKVGQFKNELEKIRNTYSKYTEAKTIGNYLEGYWSKLLKEFSLGVVEHGKLIRRLAYGDKSYTLNQIKKDFPDNEKLLGYVANSVQMNKDVMYPIEIYMLKLGAEVLKNTSMFLAVNPSETVQNIKNLVDAQIVRLRASKNIEDLLKLDDIMNRIEAIGGFESIVPLEGIVINYNGKTYKFTGIFNPISRLLRIGR